MRISDWSSDVCSSDLQSDIIFFILHAFFAEQPLGTHAIGAHHLGINFHTGHNGCSLLFAEIGIGAPNVNRPGPVGPVPRTANAPAPPRRVSAPVRRHSPSPPWYIPQDRKSVVEGKRGA